MLGLDESSRKICEIFNDKINLLRGNIPEYLFHYTSSFKAVEGIVIDNTFWYSPLDVLNDPSEALVCKEIIRKLVLNSIPEYKKNDYISFYEFIDDFNWHESDDNLIRPYTLSFTESENDVSQWKEYGNRGKGYCIKFNSKAMQPVGLNEVIPFHNGYYIPLYKVIYNNKIRDEFFEDIFSKCMPLLKSRSIVEHNIFISLLLWSSLLFKEESYSSEKEWRSILLSSSNVELDIDYTDSWASKYKSHKFLESQDIIQDKLVVKPEFNQFGDHVLVVECGIKQPHSSVSATQNKIFMSTQPNEIDHIVKVTQSKVPIR